MADDVVTWHADIGKLKVRQRLHLLYRVSAIMRLCHHEQQIGEPGGKTRKECGAMGVRSCIRKKCHIRLHQVVYFTHQDKPL